jgi:hypothetical protein
MAYERAFGPIDGAWRDDVIAEMHELLQAILQVNSDGDDMRVKRVTRPGEMWEAYKARKLREGD